MKGFTVFMVMALSCLVTASSPVIAAESIRATARAIPERPRDPHHILANAYKDNLATFGRTLRRPGTPATSVDPIMTRAAVAEMRRSFDLMKQLFQDHMNYDSNSRISIAQQQMNTKIDLIGTQLKELERVVVYNTLDPRRIAQVVETIILECGRLSAMPLPIQTNARGY